jgi:hypothetical protein
MPKQKNIVPERPRQKALLDNLVEIVDDNERRKFLFSDGLVQPITKREEGLYIPATADALSCRPPRLDRVTDLFDNMQACNIDPGDIFDAVRASLPSYSKLPTDDYYDLLTAFIFHTYRMDFVDYSPIIFLYGVAERGKSRTGKAVAFMSYRGIVTETLNAAPIFRLAEGAEPTIFFDVVDLNKKAEKQDSLDIINGRYERGVRVQRVLKPEEPGLDSIRGFNIFGPTIVAIHPGRAHADPWVSDRHA